MKHAMVATANNFSRRIFIKISSGSTLIKTTSIKHVAQKIPNIIASAYHFLSSKKEAKWR
jgi:hypothetical protein